MPAVDVWGINSYRGISFGDLFTSWQAVSNKPMFLAEFGADSYNANTKAYDPDSQAKATAALLREISAQASYSGGIALGGTIFEWADEWWKEQRGRPGRARVGWAGEVKKTAPLHGECARVGASSLRGRGQNAQSLENAPMLLAAVVGRGRAPRL